MRAGHGNIQIVLAYKNHIPRTAQLRVRAHTPARGIYHELFAVSSQGRHFLRGQINFADRVILRVRNIKRISRGVKGQPLRAEESRRFEIPVLQPDLTVTDNLQEKELNNQPKENNKQQENEVTKYTL